MKKLLSLFLILPVLFASCSNDSDPVAGSDEKGSISIGATVDMEITQKDTRAVDINTLTVVLTDTGTGTTTKHPISGLTNNTITGLEPANYFVQVTSHPDGVPVTGDEIVYAGSHMGLIEVTAGQTATATVTCKMFNTGIQFTVDQSVIDAGMTLTAEALHTEDTVPYEYDNAAMLASTPGFFRSSATAKITIYDGAIALKIDGDNDFKDINLVAGQWWDITVKVASVNPETGSITISAEIVPATPVEEEWTIGGEVEEEDAVTVTSIQVRYYNIGGTPNFDIRMYTGNGSEQIYLETFSEEYGEPYNRPSVGDYTYSTARTPMTFSHISTYYDTAGVQVPINSGTMKIVQPDNLVETNYILTGKVGYGTDGATIAFKYEGDLLKMS